MRMWLGLIGLLSMCLLTGCWDRVELTDVSLIKGVGIDRIDDGTIEVTVEVAVPQAQSQGGSEGGAALGSGGLMKVVTRSGKGKTISGALEHIQEQLPRRIFWGHSEVIVLNEKLVKEGIREQIDYFIRDPKTRIRSYVFVTKEKAKDVLSLQTLLYSPSEILWDMAESKILMNVTLVDLLQMLDSGDVAIPMVTKVPPPKGKKPNETTAYIYRTAVFKKDKMIGSINDELTRGLMWIRNEGKETQVALLPEGEKGYISLNLLRRETKLVPKIKGDKWEITVKTRTKGAIVANETNIQVKSPEEIKVLEKQLAKQIEERLNRTVQKVQKEQKADVFGFGEAFERKYPKKWREAKDKWDEIYPQVDVKLDIDATILRIGAGTATTKR
ncbi:Ger(x)C family spore germination protein [Peribacillus asahii]|uniref:Ger(x)C family spore germination protein n=1 Tax=Peribacillus asahii TaxID=228899 RepID=UPI00207A8B88|nr:Ger(x)C family spore germination protein [Peribacillus asahii]USK60964.1 Ger(x)C family spore germination protein [Peribacillus asahii]